MSAALFIGFVAFLKVVLEVASVVQGHRQQAADAARRAPVPVHVEGALPGEALAPLPNASLEICAEHSTSDQPAATSHTATISVSPIDLKDLFDPAEFLVVARRRETPQHDLFDTFARVNATTLSYPSIPEDPRLWVAEDGFDDALSVEDEIYASRPEDEHAFEYQGSD